MLYKVSGTFHIILNIYVSLRPRSCASAIFSWGNRFLVFPSFPDILMSLSIQDATDIRDRFSWCDITRMEMEPDAARKTLVIVTGNRIEKDYAVVWKIFLRPCALVVIVHPHTFVSVIQDCWKTGSAIWELQFYLSIHLPKDILSYLLYR